ncbi:MAG: hypothetical protein FIB07_15230 [Candidatus Methanoperedens sp.]|nr:hypothetical protein [Candidatus Methanoperedens sp.]
MKNITKIIISTFLVILLSNSALGYASYGGNLNATNTTNAIDIPQDTGTIPTIDLNNTTSSDQNVIITQHLIELDAVKLKAENKLFIRETLIFKNIDTKDFFGDLRTWVPEGSQNLKLARSEMMTGGGLVPIDHLQNGNIISWKDYVPQNKLPFLYALEYDVQQKADGTMSGGEIFSKKLAVPTIVNYKYVENPTIGSAVVLKITKPEGNTVKFTDENGNKVAATEVEEKEGIFRFSSPEFREINVEISSSLLPASGSQSYAIYIVIGILIILVLLYPYIKKKLQSDKTPEDTSTESETEATEINEEEEIEADSSVSSGKYEGKNMNELSDLKNQLLSRITDLEKKYESGDLLDEDYEDKRKSYQDDLKEIDEILKKMG